MRSIWQNRRDGSSRCDGCSGCEAPYPFFGMGQPKSDYMFIGQEPAYNLDDDNTDEDMSWIDARRAMEDDRRRESNPLWRVLQNASIALGCDPGFIYFTNFVKCTGGDDRYDNCPPYLAREIGDVDPNIIVGFGAQVRDDLYSKFDIDGPDTMEEAHCQTHGIEGLTVVTFYHWGYAHRTNSVTEYMEEIATTLREVQ